MKIGKGKEVKPLSNYVLISPIKDNPYIETKTESGILIPKGLAHEQADGSGRMESLEEIIKLGLIEEVGPDVKTLQQGDEVYFDIRSVRPVPFGREGVMHVNENNVIAYVR